MLADLSDYRREQKPEKRRVDWYTWPRAQLYGPQPWEEEFSRRAPQNALLVLTSDRKVDVDGADESREPSPSRLVLENEFAPVLSQAPLFIIIVLEWRSITVSMILRHAVILAPPLQTGKHDSAPLGSHHSG